jgi:hypothetical protein
VTQRWACRGGRRTGGEVRRWSSEKGKGAAPQGEGAAAGAQDMGARGRGVGCGRLCGVWVQMTPFADVAS